MFRYILFAVLLAVACAAPRSDPVASAVAPQEPESKSAPIPAAIPESIPVSIPASNPVAAPQPSAKSLSLISEVKTPASTARLAHLVAPIGSPFVAPISRITYATQLLPQLTYPYPYSGLVPLDGPSTYSIEQHGYHIAY